MLRTKAKPMACPSMCNQTNLKTDSSGTHLLPNSTKSMKEKRGETPPSKKQTKKQTNKQNGHGAVGGPFRRASPGLCDSISPYLAQSSLSRRSRSCATRLPLTDKNRDPDVRMHYTPGHCNLWMVGSNLILVEKTTCFKWLQNVSLRSPATWGVSWWGGAEWGVSGWGGAE